MFVEQPHTDSIAVDILLCIFYSILFMSAILRLFYVFLNRKNDLERTTESLLSFEDKNPSGCCSGLKKLYIHKKTQIWFFVTLLIGSFGRCIYFVLCLINYLYISNGDHYIIPKALVKEFEFIPSYPLGNIFNCLLLDW